MEKCRHIFFKCQRNTNHIWQRNVVLSPLRNCNWQSVITYSIILGIAILQRLNWGQFGLTNTLFSKAKKTKFEENKRKISILFMEGVVLKTSLIFNIIENYFTERWSEIKWICPQTLLHTMVHFNTIYSHTLLT